MQKNLENIKGVAYDALIKEYNEEFGTVAVTTYL
jgi:hypothetical protein